MPSPGVVSGSVVLTPGSQQQLFNVGGSDVLQLGAGYQVFIRTPDSAVALTGPTSPIVGYPITANKDYSFTLTYQQASGQLFSAQNTGSTGNVTVYWLAVPK